jgi:hypothetical protein
LLQFILSETVRVDLEIRYQRLDHGMPQVFGRPSMIPPTAAAGDVVPAPSFEKDPVPTLANYQMIAIESLDKWSELFTRQGNKSPPPAPVYSAASFGLGNGSF